MGSYVNYSIPLIRAAGGAMPVEPTAQGGKFILVITGDPAGATLDLRVKYAAHPTEVVVLGIQLNTLMDPPVTIDKKVTELYLPVGTEVNVALMGGSPTTMDITLILVE